MNCKLTGDEIEALKVARVKEREKNWNHLFKRYNVEGNIDDCVDWDDESGVDDDDDFDENAEAAGIDIEREKENLLTIDVSSDDEGQKEFFDVFKKCAQERIETVQEVYQKQWSEDKISEDGRHRTSTKESLVKRTNQLTINTPRRSLAPKSLSYALKAAHKHQPVNGNVGLELVKSVPNVDVNGFDDGVVSTIDESIINSPMLRKNGMTYCEQQIITTTTTTKTVVIQRCMVPEEIQHLDPIDVDDDDDDEPSSTTENKVSQPTFLTPKASTRSRRQTVDAISSKQQSTPKGTPTKRSGYLEVEIANTTPKPLKGARHSSRTKHLAIMDTPQEVHVTGKEIQKSAKEKCPTADTDRLKKREVTIDRRNESVILAFPPESPPQSEKRRDLFSQLLNTKQAMLAKQLDTSF